MNAAPRQRKIGILGAMPQEVALMARSIEIRRTVEAAMRVFHEGRWEGEEVVLVLSRVGKVSAAATTLLLIERFDVTHIVFTGVAGAVDPRLRIGDIVIADRLVQHDMDASALPAFERFEIPLLGKAIFEAEPEMLRRALAAARAYVADGFARDVAAPKRAAFGIATPAIHCGLIASGDRFLADTRATESLRLALPGALCAEMEGAAVAQVCYEMGGLPAAIVRVISDQADHAAAIDFQRCIDEVAEYVTGGVVRALLRSFAAAPAG